MFQNYEELKKAVEEKKNAKLTIEVGLGETYSQEHEDAKEELKQAKAMKALTGGQSFISDNIDALEKRVEETRPKTNNIWIQFKRVPIMLWAVLVKQGANMSVVEQYEKVLADTFIGIYGDTECQNLLSNDHTLLSTKNSNCILDGGSLINVVKAFMEWQNNGSQVTINPLVSVTD